MDAVPAPVSMPVPKLVPMPVSAPPRPALPAAARARPPLPAGGPGEPPGAAPRRAPETLHPALWLGHQLGRSAAHAIGSGFAALDAQLPGGGWPRRVLSELLLPHPGVGEIRLLAPPLVAAQRAGRLVMIFDPPAHLSAQALAGLGFAVDQLLVVNTRARVIPGSDSLWALEQALKSGHVGAVLAWLPPRLRAERLRRLQLAAHNHDGVAFVLRELAAAGRPTASPLRLSLQAGGADRLRVRILKRRGPPLEAPLQIALPAVLSEAARRRSPSAGNAHEPGRGLHEAIFVNFA
jgi:protein ImuA